MKAVVIYGDPYSGKTTQLTRLVDRFRFSPIILADLFRYHLRTRTVLGQEIERINNVGEIVSIAVIEKIIMQWLTDHKNKPENLLFDSYPRTVEQAHSLQANLGIQVVAAFYLRVPNPEQTAKLYASKHNKYEEEVYQSIKEKLTFYQGTVQEVVDYWDRTSLLAIIAADKPMQIITKEIEKIIIENNIAQH